jgi:hypothetical protein
MSNPNPPLLGVNLPISSLARNTAQQFANEQVTLYKARQTFLNTLAVWVVHDYLTLMAVKTDLTQGDSWNPLMRHCADVADLVISGVGRLECRPLLKWSVDANVPPEAWWERIAYLFVQMDSSYTQATLVGFLFRVEQVEISLSALQPIDDLFTYLHQVQQSPVTVEEKHILLRDWLEGRQTESWLELSSLLEQIKPFAFRWQSEALVSSVVTDPSVKGASRGKFVSLGLYLVPLTIQVEVSAPNRCRMAVRVFPCSGSCVIPQGLMLTVLDTETVILQTQARQQDGILQLQFSGAMGEVFQVRLSLDDRWVTQTFMI